MDFIVSLSEVIVINFTERKELTAECLKLMAFISDFLRKRDTRFAREHNFVIDEIVEEYEEPVSLIS